MRYNITKQVHIETMFLLAKIYTCMPHQRESLGVHELNYFILLLSAKTFRIRKKKGLISDFGVQPFLVIFELPHLKVNHEQKYTFFRTVRIA